MDQGAPQTNIRNPSQAPQPGPEQPDEKGLSPRSLLIIFCVLFIILGIFGPTALGFEAFLYVGIVGLGLTSGISIIIAEFRRAKNASNPLVAMFMLVAGLGIGIVIFIVTLFATSIAYYGKNPDELQCG